MILDKIKKNLFVVFNMLNFVRRKKRAADHCLPLELIRPRKCGEKLLGSDMAPEIIRFSPATAGKRLSVYAGSRYTKYAVMKFA
jgi:hypothetical protein